MINKYNYYYHYNYRKTISINKRVVILRELLQSALLVSPTQAKQNPNTNKLNTDTIMAK